MKMKMKMKMKIQNIVTGGVQIRMQQ